MKNTILQLISFIAILGFCSLTTAQDNAVRVDFESDIKPILESNCLRCHNEENAEGGYRLDSHEDAMDYIEEGDSESSDLYLALISDEEDVMMPPPDEGGPLDDSDIKMIQTWINEGATWPASVKLQDPDATTNDSSDDTQEGTEESASPDKMPGGKSKKPTIPFAIGLLHPAAIHLPIGLLLGAGLFALLSIRGNFVMSDCAYYCLWLGTIGAIIACATGWWFALDQYPKEYIEVDQLVAGLQNMEHKLFWHRTSALIVTGFALLLCLYAASARNHDPDDGVSWKMGAIILAMGIGFVGHQGGELSWKESHYDEFWEVVGEYIPGVAAEKEVDPQENDSAIDDDEAASGETSDDGAGPDDVST